MKCRVAINKHKESSCYLVDYVIESNVSDFFVKVSFLLKLVLKSISGKCV